MGPDMDRALGRLIGESVRAGDDELGDALSAIVVAHWVAESPAQEVENEAAIRVALFDGDIRDRVIALIQRLDASDDPMWPSSKQVLGL